ncbi:UNVERIFIED_CONTAM: protein DETOXIFICATION 24 [Sesamum calycinum]|uniref:Protein DETOXIFICATION 24 n=1 Tax=Sesamum calycinum TaxID=2727403 RepID=A0AAW2RT21_9LAMI
MGGASSLVLVAAPSKRGRRNGGDMRSPCFCRATSALPSVPTPLPAMDSEAQERLLTSGTGQESSDLKGRRVFEESKKIWRVALPSVISRVSSFGTVVVTQSVLGHISAVDLAAYALVHSLGVRFVNGVLIGMSSATETLFAAKHLGEAEPLMGIFCGPHSIVLDFVYLLEWGLLALWRLNTSAWLVVFGEFIYVFGGWCPDSWKGFSLAALKDIPPVVKLSISSGLMVCLELWYYAILVLIAGYMKNAEVAISAFSVCVRVANELGRGDAKAVIFSIKVLLCTSVLIGILCWILCIVFGNKIGYLFSNDEEVAKTVSDLSLLLAFSILFNSIYPVFSGVAVGAGLQATVAIVNVVCFYLIGLPIGLVLGYSTHLQVKGLWIGMLCGVITETLALSFLMWRTNWDEEVLKASARLKRWYLKSPEEAAHQSDHA